MPNNKISCKTCKGTGFIKLTQEQIKNKKYCKTCINSERCYLCQNIIRGLYDCCWKCYGDGYFLTLKSN
jgi:DnaJ-class molecular chaperone